MISFKEYLNEYYEKNVLYHATYFEYALEIVKSNILKVGAKYEGFHNASVSLTRSLPFAKRWRRPNVIFCLDRNKLQQRYKIIPYSYMGQIATNQDHRQDSFGEKSPAFHNQQEEQIQKDIKNINQYIIKVYVPRSSAHTSEELEPITSKFNIEFY